MGLMPDPKPYSIRFLFPMAALEEPWVALRVLEDNLRMRDKAMIEQGHRAVTPWEWEVLQPVIEPTGNEDEWRLVEGDPTAVMVVGRCMALEVPHGREDQAAD